MSLSDPTLAQLFVYHRWIEATSRLRELLQDKETKHQNDQLDVIVAENPTFASDFLHGLQLLSTRTDLVSLSDVMEIVLTAIRRHTVSINANDQAVASQLLQQSFQRVPVSTTAIFSIVYGIDDATLRAFASELLGSQPTQAIRFLELVEKPGLVSTEAILTALIAKQDFPVGDKYVRKHPEHAQAYISLLLQYHVNDKVVKKRIAMFKLTPEQFPVFVERRQKATLRYLIATEKFQEALAMAQESASERIATYVCEKIFKFYGPTHRVTKQFVYRLHRQSQFPTVQIDGNEATQQLPQQDDYEVLDGHVHLTQFISMDNIHFVNSMPALEACVAHLKTRPVVGFDCENKPSHKATDDHQCALLQLASSERAFVIDMMHFPDPGELLSSVFLSDTVLKLGFDTKQDLKMLRRAFQTRSHIARRLLDLQVVAKKLQLQSPVKESTTTKKPSLSLSAITLQYVGKPLDKRAQVSNWERRPLTTAQLQYAALDAYILVQILRNMQQVHGENVVQSIVDRYTQALV